MQHEQADGVSLTLAHLLQHEHVGALVGDAVPLAVTLAVGVAECETLTVLDSETLAVAVGDAVLLAVSLGDGTMVALSLAVRDAVTLPLDDGVALAVALAVELSLSA
jgi:hypothetical protein